MRRLALPIVLSVWMVGVTGCSSTMTTNTARAAREQLLISNAVDRSLNKVNFAPLANQRAYIEEKYLNCVDKPYITGSIRHHVVHSGAAIVENPDDADVIMEIRSGGVGTDQEEAFIGVPEITLPGMLTLPEIRVATKSTQQGFAKIGIVLLDARSRKSLGTGGVSLAHSADTNWSVLGVGPFQSGTVRQEIQTAKTRQPGQPWQPLPRRVAFSAPERDQSDNTIQLTSEAKEVE